MFTLCSFGVQNGGAISIWGSNNRADLTSCALSGNKAGRVCGHTESGVVQETSLCAACGDRCCCMHVRGV